MGGQIQRHLIHIRWLTFIVKDLTGNHDSSSFPTTKCIGHPKNFFEDLKEIEDRTYIYVVKDGTVKEERKLTDLPTFIQM